LSDELKGLKYEHSLCPKSSMLRGVDASTLLVTSPTCFDIKRDDSAIVSQNGPSDSSLEPDRASLRSLEADNARYKEELESLQRAHSGCIERIRALEQELTQATLRHVQPVQPPSTGSAKRAMQALFDDLNGREAEVVEPTAESQVELLWQKQSIGHRIRRVSVNELGELQKNLPLHVDDILPTQHREFYLRHLWEVLYPRKVELKHIFRYYTFHGHYKTSRTSFTINSTAARMMIHDMKLPTQVVERVAVLLLQSNAAVEKSGLNLQQFLEFCVRLGHHFMERTMALEPCPARALKFIDQVYAALHVAF